MTSRFNRRRGPVIKGLISLLWLLLFSLLLQRDYFIKSVDSREALALERAERVEYQGIYFKDKKIGYVENQFTPEPGGGLHVTQQATMRLNIVGQTQRIDLDLQAFIAEDNRLNRFTFTFSSPFYRMSAAGSVDGSTVSFWLDTGTNRIEDEIRLSGPPLLSTSRRSYLLGGQIEPGRKIRVPWFDPVSLTGKDSVIEYRGREKVLVSGRVFNLHRFTEIFAGVRVNSWLDDEGNVVKEESPAGFVFIREPEFKARQLDDESSELLSSVAVTTKGPLPALAGRSFLRYRLVLPADASFDLDGGRQEFADGILTVRLEPPQQTAAAEPACAGSNADRQPTPYLQAAAPEIIERSRQITAGLDSAQEKAVALADWVYRSLEKRPVLGIPDALTTLKSRIGDCNEHASLFAALARAAGIPTKIAAGVVYHKEAFYYHAWNEVCLGDRWFSLDTTTNQFPADLSHIKFLEGGLQEQVRIGALLGALEIEPLAD